MTYMSGMWGGGGGSAAETSKKKYRAKKLNLFVTRLIQLHNALIVSIEISLSR